MKTLLNNEDWYDALQSQSVRKLIFVEVSKNLTTKIFNYKSINNLVRSLK